jgi:hypothetical protein
MPTLQRVVQTQDVVFAPLDSKTEEVYLDQQELQEIATTVDIPNVEQDKEELQII